VVTGKLTAAQIAARDAATIAAVERLLAIHADPKNPTPFAHPIGWGAARTLNPNRVAP
jgi:hypothetical protein